MPLPQLLVCGPSEQSQECSSLLSSHRVSLSNLCFISCRDEVNWTFHFVKRGETHGDALAPLSKDEVGENELRVVGEVAHRLDSEQSALGGRQSVDLQVCPEGAVDFDCQIVVLVLPVAIVF